MGLLLAPAEGFRRDFFFALWAEKNALILFGPILSHFWCSVVTSITFINNLSNFEKTFKKCF